MQVSGECSKRFAGVEKAFVESFSEHGDTGASLAIFYRGEQQLDLWGGMRDKKDEQPWEADTCSNIFSAGKPLVAVSLLQQLEKTGVSLDAPVQEVWPEFEQSGVTLRQVLCHRSGFSAFHDEMPDEIIYNWEQLTARLAKASPWWTPNESQGYSPMIFGWFAGELCRRLAGAGKFNDVVQECIARPLGIDAGFGLSEAAQAQMADVRPLDSRYVPKGEAKLMGVFKEEPGGVTQKAFTNPMSIMIGTNSAAWRGAEIPGGNASSNARSMATFYNALLEPGILLGEKMTRELNQQQSYSDCDNVLKTPLGFGLGFMLSDDRPEARFGYGKGSFGHPGFGGSIGFADPENQLAFSYTSRDMGQSLLLDPRAIRIIKSVYACL